MLDLRTITDEQVAEYVYDLFSESSENSDRWRLLGSVAELTKYHSFTQTRTYPRPDHPDPSKRLSLEYLLVSILISLRTTLENEQKAVSTLIGKFPTTDLLYAAQEDELANCIRVAGMPQQKAKRIFACLRQIERLEGGLESLSEKTLVEARSFLLSLPGIGPKSADCLLTIGLNHPSMVVDVNVFRMGVSLFGISWDKVPSYANSSQVAQVKVILDDAIGNDVFLCQIAHTLLLLEGRRSKMHSPQNCRLSSFCISCSNDPIKTLF